MAKTIIKEKRDLLKRLSDLLIEKETIDITDLNTILGPRPFEAKGTFKKFLEEKSKYQPNA